jgi:hypothetical protein
MERIEPGAAFDKESERGLRGHLCPIGPHAEPLVL